MRSHATRSIVTPSVLKGCDEPFQREIAYLLKIDKNMFQLQQLGLHIRP